MRPGGTPLQLTCNYHYKDIGNFFKLPRFCANIFFPRATLILFYCGVKGLAKQLVGPTICFGSISNRQWTKTIGKSIFSNCIGCFSNAQYPKTTGKSHIAHCKYALPIVLSFLQIVNAHKQIVFSLLPTDNDAKKLVKTILPTVNIVLPIFFLVFKTDVDDHFTDVTHSFGKYIANTYAQGHLSLVANEL